MAIGVFGVYGFAALYFFSDGVKAVFPFVEVAPRLDNGLEIAPISVENEGLEGRNIVRIVAKPLPCASVKGQDFCKAWLDCCES